MEIERGEEAVRIYHRGTLVATHPRLEGKYRLAILPEHGPGALPRNPRRLHATPPPPAPRLSALPEVEVRDLAVYEALIAEVAP